MKIFMTGATGLIGSHVAERLVKDGDRVLALVRTGSETGHLRELGCECVTGDLADPTDALAAAMRGCDAVVHAAAKVFEGGSREEFLRTNVAGTERVLEAAARSAPRVVHLSSVAVYAGLRPDPALSEERWTEADPERQGAYAASKHLSERAAWRLHETGAIRLTTVRPCVVYGERDRAATPILVRYATLPVVPLIAGGHHRLPLVYAGNVAAGVVEALRRDTAIGRAYNLARDEPITLEGVVRLVNESLGRKPRMVPVPAAVPAAIVGVLNAVGRVIPVARRPGLSRALRGITADNPYDSTRARLELGWRAEVSHREAVRRTLAWWQTR